MKKAQLVLAAAMLTATASVATAQSYGDDMWARAARATEQENLHREMQFQQREMERQIQQQRQEQEQQTYRQQQEMYRLQQQLEDQARMPRYIPVPGLR